MLPSRLPSRMISLLILGQAIHIPLVSAAQCYWNNGAASIDEFQPCFPDRANSACCGLNKSPGEPKDICTTSGLCYLQVTPYTGHIMLNSCTDENWGSSDCPKICPTSVQQSSGTWVLSCPMKGKDRWCCSDDGSDCCDSDFQLDVGQLMLATTNSTLSSPANATTVETVTSTVYASGQGDANVSSATTVAVGAGVGAGLGACLIATGAALLFQRRLYAKKLQELSGVQEKALYDMYQNPSATAPGPVEMPLNNKPAVYEMGGGNTR